MSDFFLKDGNFNLLLGGMCFFFLNLRRSKKFHFVTWKFTVMGDQGKHNLQHFVPLSFPARPPFDSSRWSVLTFSRSLSTASLTPGPQHRSRLLTALTVKESLQLFSLVANKTTWQLIFLSLQHWYSLVHSNGHFLSLWHPKHWLRAPPTHCLFLKVH